MRVGWGWSGGNGVRRIGGRRKIIKVSKKAVSKILDPETKP